MKKILAVMVVLTMVLTVLAGCGGNGSANTTANDESLTFEAYVDWIISEIGSTSPDPEGFRAAMLETASSYDEINPDELPWLIVVNADMYNFTPYDQWVANGGQGTYNASFSVEDAFGTPSAEPQN